MASGPSASVIFGPDGTLYARTQDGGNGYGTVLNLSPSAVCTTPPCAWTETVLYAFKGDPDCAYPGCGDLAFDHEGNIYGMTYNVGTNNRGCVYKLTPFRNRRLQRKAIYRFGGGNDGYYPFAGLILDSAGKQPLRDYRADTVATARSSSRCPQTEYMPRISSQFYGRSRRRLCFRRPDI